MITACRERSHSPVLKVVSWGYTRLVMVVMGSGAWIPTDAELCQAFSASCWAWCFGFGTWSEAAPLLQLSQVVGWESGLANPLNCHWTHHVAFFWKKAWGLEAMLEVREERNEELPAIDLRRISWPCQLMTSGDESWNTHPWVTLKKKIFFALHAEMLISDSQQETIGHRCLWESPAFALRDLGLRWCQPLGHCTSYLAYRN